MAYKEIYISKETYENLHIARNVLYEGFVINYGYAYIKAIVVQPTYNGYNSGSFTSNIPFYSDLTRMQFFDDSEEVRKLSLRGHFINGKATIKVDENMTLSSIAESFDVTVDDLMKWNNIKNANIICKDQILVIYKKDSTPLLTGIYNFIKSKPINDTLQITGIAATIMQKSNVSFYNNSMKKPAIFKGWTPSNAIKVVDIEKSIGNSVFFISVMIDSCKIVGSEIDYTEYCTNTTLNFIAWRNPYFGIIYGSLELFYPGGFKQSIVDKAILEKERREVMGKWYLPLCVKSYQ